MFTHLSRAHISCFSKLLKGLMRIFTKILLDEGIFEAEESDKAIMNGEMNAGITKPEEGEAAEKE